MISVGVLLPDDRPTWETLFAGYNDFYGRTLPQESCDRTWREFQEADRMHALGARLDGRLVGITHFLVHASTTSADVCYLQDLFTAPEARGQGVARALIAAARMGPWPGLRPALLAYAGEQRHRQTALRPDR